MQFTLISDALMNKQAVLSVLCLPVVCADAIKASLAAFLLTVETMKRDYSGKKDNLLWLLGK